jgi:hypothetical protein
MAPETSSSNGDVRLVRWSQVVDEDSMVGPADTGADGAAKPQLARSVVRADEQSRDRVPLGSDTGQPPPG